VQGGSPSEREDGKPPGIYAAADRHQADPFGHMRVYDAMNALCGHHAFYAQFARDRIDDALSRPLVEAHPAAQKTFRIEEAENQIGIRHRRFRAAAAIAGRPRLRAGAFGAHMQQAAIIDTRNRAATRANAGNVEALQRYALACESPVGRDGRLAAYHQRDVRGGAAHVERDEVPMAEQARSILAAGNATRGSRKHAAGRQPNGLGYGRHTAVRLDDQHRRGEARLAQPLLEPR